MATPSRGQRATPARVAELQAQIARLEGRHDARLDRLEQEVAALRGDLGLALVLVRSRIGAELTALKRLEEPKT